MRRLGGAIAVSTLIAGVISWLLRGVPIGREALLVVLLMPVVSLGTFVIAARMGLVSLPNSVREKLRKRAIGVKLFGSKALEPI